MKLIRNFISKSSFTGMNKLQIILVVFVLAAVFLLTYYPSFTTPFPKHNDEWRHIDQALSLARGEYQWQKLPAFGLGFHIFLYGISRITDLVLIYKFLAPTWAVLSALTLFFITYSLTKKNFLTAFLAIIFFSSIKSNINLLGLYFFTPLSFSIPFIFLFIFFFVRGLEKENKKYILLSFLIMLFLVFIHATSVTFALPILLFSSILYYKYIKKEFRFFLIFLLIPLVGLFFHSFVTSSIITESLGILIKELHFPEGWGQAGAFNDSLTTTYSIIGGILAGISVIAVLWRRKRELYPYVFWPIYLIIAISIFRMTDISYLSPYHRNFYYFTISLPFLSAYGLNWIINFITTRFKILNFKIIIVPMVIITVFFCFVSYFKEEDSTRPSYVKTIIDNNDYRALLFLAQLPKSKILVHPELIVAAAPVTGHNVIGSFFDDNLSTDHVFQFIYMTDCEFRDALIEAYNVDYVVSRFGISCGYKILSDTYGNNYIYKVNINED